MILAGGRTIIDLEFFEKLRLNHCLLALLLLYALGEVVRVLILHETLIMGGAAAIQPSV